MEIAKMKAIFQIEKRIILSFVLSAFGTQITVSAEELLTPSGIPYSEISRYLYRDERSTS